MGMHFVGGPYDEMEIDPALINKHAQLVPVPSVLGMRLFVGMPKNRDVWERMIQGEKVTPDVLFPYERAFTPVGAHFIASPPGSLDRALSEAKLKVDPRARTALAALSAEDRRRVLEAADDLQHRPPKEWPGDQVLRISEDEPIYLLRVTPELRAFIRIVADGQVELLDIVREDTLRLFSEKHRDTGAPR
jgi:hypothetical protein